MKLIIDIPEEVMKATKVHNLYPSQLDLICEQVLNGTPIPDNATNGDLIRAIFPYCKYNEYFADVEMKTEENDTRFKSVFDRDWWNAPY